MMMRMKLTFILAILLFQLTISVKGGGSASKPAQQEDKQEDKQEYHFGDIIKFDRFAFNHYAIWVGDKVFGNPNIRQNGQDIFHFPGEIVSTVTKCAFDSLEAVKGRSTPVVDNYLDGKKDIRTDAQMIQDIVTLNNDCGRYFVIKNNCEHIATTIRYGEAVCLQQGSNIITETVARFCCATNRVAETLKKNQKRGRGRRGLGLLRDESRANQGAPAA
nr:retinoic acid receptor responder protein 3-like [Salvelinus alpinus]